MTFKGSRRRRAIRLFAGILLVIAVMGAVVAYLILMLEWGRDFSVESVRTTIEGLGVWGVFASIGLMVVHSFLPFPAEVVAIANGMFYGPVWGTVITWIGAMLGALGAFGLTRLLGQPFVAVMISERDQRRLDEWTERHGARLIFIARLVPVIAFNLINYAAGLTRISWWTFVWSTSLGILPFTMLMVVVGDRFMTMSWELWLSLLGGGVILWVLFRRWLNPRRRWRTPGTGG